jgi:hypothetical protein
MYSYQPCYTADNNAAETDMCAVHKSTLSHTSCGKLESCLFQRTNSEPHKCVYYSQININMERFTWPKLTNIHLVYSVVNGNGREMQKIYHEHFPNTVCPDYCTFTVNHHIWETGTSAVNSHSTVWGRSVHMPKFDEDVLQCCRIHKHLHGWSQSVDCSLVWNVVCEQELHHFHWQKVQALLGPSDYLHQDQFVHWFVHQST